MENYSGGFDRANDQGQNHDIKGNIENVDNDTLKKDDDTQANEKVDNPDLAKEIPTVTPETEPDVPNDTPELEKPTDQTASNKGQGPSGENL